MFCSLCYMLYSQNCLQLVDHESEFCVSESHPERKSRFKYGTSLHF